jgi:hypothetical protein
MKSALCASLAVLMAAGSGASMAQPAAPDYNQQQRDYQRQQQQYQRAQAQYEDQRRAYEQQRAAYKRARDDYDSLHGSGAFLRYYSAHPSEYDQLYGLGAYERDFGLPVAYGDDPYRGYRGSACEQRQTDRAVAGGVIGALAGAALGSNLAAGGGRTGGAIIGGVLGGVVGADVGRTTAHCDYRGYYFSYNETHPYHEGEWERGRSGRYDYAYYNSHGCRLAVAPAHVEDRDEYRYVRVCPDEQDRYRITD